MKAKYLFVSLIAAATALVGCQKEETLSLKEISLENDKSTIALNPAGGTYALHFTTTGDWELAKLYSSGAKDENNKNIIDLSCEKWISVDKESGAAGDNTLTITYEGADYGRATAIRIVSGAKFKDIRLVQGLATTAEASCAEVLEGPDSQTYRVTGIVTKIVNTLYGNWYLNDGTGEVYIYGTLDKNGNNGANNSITAWGIEVGDVITVEGPKTTYNGTVELVDVAVVKLVKSLVKIEAGETASFDAEGGSFAVRLTTKGNGPAVAIPEEAKEWISISDISMDADTTVVSFHVAPNEQEDARDAEIGFTSVSGSNSSTVYATVSQTGLKGTLTTPFSVAEAIAYTNTLSGESAADFVVKGIVSKVVYTYSAKYGTATFWISDDGTFYDDATKDFEAYGVYFFNNQEWKEGNAQIEEGATVLLNGKLTLYKGTAETSNKKAYVYSINGVSDDTNGVGTLGNPFNVAGAIAYAGTTDLNVYIKGKVSAVLYTYSAKYNNGTFWISDDGTAYGVSDDKKSTSAKDKDFEAYSVYLFGIDNPWVEGTSPQVAVGDDVILYGQTTLYNGTAETAGKKAYIYSLNGKTE